MKSIVTILILFSYSLIYGQIANHNLTSVGNLTYTPILNDIWGYVDSAGTEYALVGNYDGVSVVSLATPSNPVEVAFINANASTWRDIKTYGPRVYAVTEGGGGVMIIDLSDLPNSVSHHFDTTSKDAAHNIWIDEQGFLFSVGGSQGGHPFFYDIYTNPDSLIYKGEAVPTYYSHDVYVRGDTLWSASIYEGFFSVYDVSDKNNPVLLATQNTPRDFCHNIWLSDDGNTLFATDEKAGAWVAAYDVSDLSDIKEIDRWRTPTPGVVPHNVHIINDYLVVSYYDEGIIILDGSRPSNLVEVGRYDSSPLPPTGLYSGAWGAYPFLPSGKILVSDRQTGLHVLQPNYQRACWLEGKVTDSLSGIPLLGIAISISGSIPSQVSDFLGEYKTGTVVAGSYQMTFSKFGYISKTISTTLQNGVLTIENIELVPSPTALLEIDVTDNQSWGTIANTIIELRGVDTSYFGQTDQNGHFQKQVLFDNYELWTGHWGHQTQKNSININADITIPVQLNKGYKDEFALDLGWTLTSNVVDGDWLIQNPDTVPSFIFPIITLDSDDLGIKCLTTGAYPEGGNPLYWLDSGSTTISSPMMDLVNTIDPYLNFQYHYSTFSFSAQTFLEAIITNGTDTATVVRFDSINNLAVWKMESIRIKDYISLSNNMQVHFKAINPYINNTVKMWVDDFSVLDSMGNHIAVDYIDNKEVLLHYSPNPFSHELSVSYEQLTLPARLEVFNALGQSIERQVLEQNKGNLSLGQAWEAGLYFIRIGNQTLRVVKF